jgi:hypothetical protein
MTRLQFEIKHGHLPAGCCYLGWCGREAKRDARSITLTLRESNWLKPETTQSYDRRTQSDRHRT